MKITGIREELMQSGNPRWIIFTEFQYALRADKYSVTIAGWRSDGTTKERTFLEMVASFGKGMEEFDDPNQTEYTPDEFEDMIFELQAFNMMGNDIYMTPLSDEFFYVVLDELKLSEEEMWNLRHEYLPCLIAGTPAGNYQFILKARKSEIGNNDRERLNQFVKHINKKHNGNKSVGDIIHSFR